MGASLVYLNEPNTEIEHEIGQNDYLKFAAGSMQGWRLNMVSSIDSNNIIAKHHMLASHFSMYSLAKYIGTEIYGGTALSKKI